VPIGIEPLAGSAEPLHSLALEDRSHLVAYGLQPFNLAVAGRHVERRFDAVHRVQPVTQHPVARVGDAGIGQPLRPLAIVVEIGKRPLVAVVELIDSGLEIRGPGAGRPILLTRG